MKKKQLLKILPAVLTCMSAVGVIATAVLSSMATVKATELLKSAEDEKGEKLDKTEAVKAVAPAYIPTVLLGMSTIVCMFGTNVINKRHQASIASAYALLNQYHKEYRSNVKAICGEDAERQVRTEMLRQHYNYHISDLNVPDQKVIFYDDISGNSVIGYERDIIDAEYHLNRNFSLRGYVSLNELYEMLGMPKTEEGDKLGWSVSDGYSWIDFEHTPVSTDESGLDVYSIDMLFYPEEGYEEDWI